MTSRVLAAVSALLTLGVLVAVFAITNGEGDSPPLWFVGLMLVATAGLVYGTTSGARRASVLVAASGLLLALGVLAIFSVGLLLLIAGALGLVASSTTAITAPDAARP